MAYLPVAKKLKNNLAKLPKPFHRDSFSTSPKLIDKILNIGSHGLIWGAEKSLKPFFFLKGHRHRLFSQVEIHSCVTEEATRFVMKTFSISHGGLANAGSVKRKGKLWFEGLNLESWSRRAWAGLIMLEKKHTKSGTFQTIA